MGDASDGLLHCELNPTNTSKLHVCAVNFLNTTPLVWGMLHGPQQGLFDLDFDANGQMVYKITGSAAASLSQTAGR